MAPAPWMDRMVVAKQAMDLCSPSYTQLLVAEYLKRGLLSQQIDKICSLYSRKLRVMLKALKQYMPEGVKWSKPKGGLFLWIELPETISTTDLFPKAVENGVAYVIGSAFHCDGKGQNTMRMNFSYSSEQQIIEGIKRLAETLRLKM